ncbi:MAG: glycosyltransferase, partial [Proteobacteria bacterium]|nr:glycosyltransferase [Pseudomonadota bacterium]
MEENESVFRNQIRVLYITQSLGGGVQKYVIQLCRNLHQQRFSVTGCCSAEQKGGDGDIPFSEAFRQIGVPYFVVPMQRSISLWKDFSSFVKIYKNIKEKGFDVVHAHSSKAGVLARVAARLAGIPVVIYSPHAFSFDGPGHIIAKLPYILFEKIASFFCDTIITDSLSEKKLALKYKIGSNKKNVVIPPGIDIQDYNPEISKQVKTDCQKRLGVSRKNKVVTMV